MTLEQLRKLCDEATPGPWYAGTVILDEDERFIIAARTYMPLLLAVAEAAKDAIQTAPLAKALAELEEQLK